MSPTADKVIYEHPLNEKTRTLLRLDHLFQHVDHHLPIPDVWSSRATVDGLLDMVSIFSRAEIKADLIKELDRHKEKLSRIRRTPGLDTERLDQILEQLERANRRLYAIDGQIGQALRKSEFLKTILQRSAIPGGSCAFDLPAYHYWLEQPYETRRRQLEAWLETLAPIKAAVVLILSLVRNSTDPTSEVATSGFFQRSLDPQTPAQMIRVGLPRELQLFAEISGGKHRFSIRFLEPSCEERPSQTQQEVSFSLHTCIL
ncbi:MAG TPA: cell division protein ZapD [Sedimenticola sp.]|nr:cell division protein ZapD [Sedimenticola sp.]